MKMSSNIKFINIPAPILKLDIPDKAQILLALVAGFRGKGLFVSNNNLASLFGCTRNTIINNLNRLREEGYIVDAGPDKQHRNLVASGVIVALLEGGGSTTGLTTGSETGLTISGQSGATSCTHNINNNKNNKQSGAGVDVSCSVAWFDQFWEAYPKKQKRPAAIKEWGKLNPDTDLFEKIMAGLSAWKTTEQWTKENGKYIPNAKNWLSNRQWEDKISEPDGPASLTRAVSCDEARKLLEDI